MADQTAEELRLLLENLRELNRTTRTLAEDQTELDEQYFKLGVTLARTDADASQRADKQAALERSMSRRARSLAQQHLEAARQAKTLSGRLQQVAGSSIELQTQVLRAEESIDKLNRGFRTAIEITGNLATAFGGVAKSMAAGNAKFTDFAGVTDAAISGFKTLAKDVPVVGGILGATFTALGGAARISIDMLQMTSDMFENLSKTGVLGAEGMDGIKEQADAARLSLREFERVTVANSVNLARFGGTASDGAQRFGKVMGEVMDEAGTELRMLGFNREQIGEATAAFLAQQSRLGLQRTKSDAQLAKQTAIYAKELDALAKLTGMQREEIVRQQDAALSEARFRARYDELVAQGREGEAKALLDFQTMLSKAAPGLAQGFRDLSSNFATTDAAQEVLRLGGQSILDSIQAGGGPVDAFRQLQGLIEPQAEMARSIAAAVGDDVRVVGRYVELSDVLRAKIIDGDVVLQDRQKKQIEQTQGLSAQIATGREALDALQKKIEDLAVNGVVPATTAVKTFASVLDKGVDVLKNILGFDGSKSEIWKIIGTTAGTIIGQAIGATLGTLVGGIIGAIKGFLIGGPLGAAIGAAVGAASGATIGGGIGAVAGGGTGMLAGSMADRDLDRLRGVVPPDTRRPSRRGRRAAPRGAAGVEDQDQQALDPADLFDFTGGITGHQRNYENLNPQFRSRLTQMAAEYLEKTGSKLPFGSGQRSQEENRSVRGARKSLHVEGLAADLSSDAVNRLKDLGLLEKYGFKQNSRSAWHISETGYRDGGIASGPKQGYEAMLHGIEAVVPLPDGKTIPVSLKTTTTEFAELAKDFKFNNNMLPEIRNILVDEINNLTSDSATVDAAIDRLGSQFQQTIRDFIAQQRNQGDLGSLMQEMVNLQRGLNATSERMLQVAQN